ncbi:soluble guanylate cyclase 88E-like [Trichogramma pretiosum]|uniref:soluble guanylate cyclase 88E-like n=1 Tax=Trichogramma pretiosum TaxID=7493 RepID=UPI0006C9BE77|nr:soluble guanylate cyclase 88E-like [Trichogramma pretiosum]
MYGIIIENVAEYVRHTYSEETWEEVLKVAGMTYMYFNVNQVYPERMMPKLTNAAMQVLGVTESELFERLGHHFHSFITQHGYDSILNVLGRHVRDFLNGLDNFHEYLKFSYPRMIAPSFSCEKETREGLILHYRSKRKGLKYYALGVIKKVVTGIYEKDIEIEILRDEMESNSVHVTFQLKFDNSVFEDNLPTINLDQQHLSIRCNLLKHIFPFGIVFRPDMTIIDIGNSLDLVLPNLVGHKINHCFDLIKPAEAFQFPTIMARMNNSFELLSVEPVLAQRNDEPEGSVDDFDLEDEEKKRLKLKGQMIYIEEWKMIMYLGTPKIPDLAVLMSINLYVNDLSLHDFSRDLVMAGTQQSVDLKMLLEQIEHKGKKKEEANKELSREMQRTEELLYRMIPQNVSDRLRRGEQPIDTCEIFDSVSILFSDIVNFTAISSRLSAMEVVKMLNSMWLEFDKLTEKHETYKVETIGDAYMVVAGAPVRSEDHADRICNMALDMLVAIGNVYDPSSGEHLKIRIGINSGAVVAGIVGLKMPRYGLFGKPVNVASRMEATSEPMQIHISQSTRQLLSPVHQVVQRPELLKIDDMEMQTYFLVQSRAPRHRIKIEISTPAPSPGGSSSSKSLSKLSSPINSRPASPSVYYQDVRRLYSPVTVAEVISRRSSYISLDSFDD